jgi:uncharacterized protein
VNIGIRKKFRRFFLSITAVQLAVVQLSYGLNLTREIDSDDAYLATEWTDLIPKQNLEALLNPPEYLQNIKDGTLEDQISSEIKIEASQTDASRYQQALVSTEVISALNGRKIRLPGFIVPLEFNDALVVTEFFLVPYFGACLHVPPPPPNQIVYVKYIDGIQIESLDQAFWVSGQLTTDSQVNDMAHAAYSMKAVDVSYYGE